MRIIQFSFLFIFISVSVFAQDKLEKHPAVRAVEIFFSGFHSGDTLLMSSVLVDKAKLYTATTRASGENILSETPMDNLLKAITKRPATDIWKEKLTDTLLHTDGNLAMVWAPYAFSRNDQFSHCGANLFTVVKLDSGWKIMSITDSRRQDDCTNAKE